MYIYKPCMSVFNVNIYIYIYIYISKIRHLLLNELYFGFFEGLKETEI